MNKRAKQRAFLKAFAACGQVTKAAEAAGIDRSLHYDWMQNDPGYPHAFGRVQEQAAQLLEDEAVRRAYEGVQEPVVYQGNFTYEPLKNEKGELVRDENGAVLFNERPLAIRKFSDSLLQFILKGLKPERYRDRGSVEVTGANGGPIAVTDARLANLTDDELSGLIAVARKLAEPGEPRGGTAPPATE